MLTIKYLPTQTDDTVLLADAEIDDFLICASEKDMEITVSQVSILYVLRKLVALNKINFENVCVNIDETIHTISKHGRFNSHYPIQDDLFDVCLDAILSRT